MSTALKCFDSSDVSSAAPQAQKLVGLGSPEGAQTQQQLNCLIILPSWARFQEGAKEGQPLHSPRQGQAVLWPVG